MKNLYVLLLLTLAAPTYSGIYPCDCVARGDVDEDGDIDITDLMNISNWLFGGGPAPADVWTTDINGDGSTNNSDIVYLSNYLYAGGPPPHENISPHCRCLCTTYMTEEGFGVRYECP